MGKLVLTSITSYSWRDLLVVRDTTALTASFTGGTLGFPEPIYTLTSPLYDRTNAKAWTQEIRISREQERLEWLAGLYYSHGERDYGQDVTVPGFTAMTNIPTEGLLAPEDSIYFSEFDYALEQYALFGEATASLTDRFRLTGGLRYYDFSEDKQQLVDGLGGNPNNGVSVLSLPGQTDANGFAPRLIAAYELSKSSIFNAQVSRGFRLGGINDPLNVPLCSTQDLITFGGHETWGDETVWNYELGYKSRLLGGNGSFNASAFYVDIDDLQTTVTAGTCSSRVVFNVPKARSQGVELEFAHAPTRNFDFTISGTYTDAELQSTLTSTDNTGNVSIVSGIESGRRLPSVPREQAAAAATWQFDAFSGSRGYVTGSYQYVGTRFTQVGDEDLGVLDMTTALPNPSGPIGAPFTQNTFTYDPELPAYSLLNLRVGVRNGVWDVSAYVNNVTDELALLAFDRERGTAARIGYMTNQPRTFGVSTRYNF
jgi:iron complex outermembrane receptor protein